MGRYVMLSSLLQIVNRVDSKRAYSEARHLPRHVRLSFLL